MRIGLVTVQVPFVRGGAEMLAESLMAALRAAGHQAEIIAIPFKWYPPRRIAEHMLACRLIDLEESCGVPIDRVIGLKFPAYLAPHPDKVLWLLHQHREVYDLWDSELTGLRHEPEGPHVRQMVQDADTRMIPEARGVFTISQVVTERLRRFNGIASRPLYHPPPGAERLMALEPAPGDFLLMPSRLNPSKRQGLVIQALSRTRHPVRVVFMGGPDDPAHAAALRIAAGPLGERAVWAGAVTEAERLRLYAECLGVVFPPVDEDYGYVTLEAMLARKPVVTCTDSGGPLEFVLDRETGMVVAPSAEAVAEAMDRLWEDRAAAARMGAAGRERYDSMKIGWDTVLAALLG